ncbi:MAG: FHA domain-containing protein [Pirellulales bacterium]|nr:FHA domain-containing protein [Pirellulales bacterium]
MEVKLVVLNGKLAGTEIPIARDSFLIGRGEECHLRPQSGMVSRKHCMIRVADGAATIEDCGSTNGTFLNDQRIARRCELHNGDRVRVGMLGFEVQMAVSVGGKKKPKVHSIHEAAARTADSSPSLTEDMDISGWLEEDGGVSDSTPTRQEPVSLGDTMAGKSLTDTSSLPTQTPIEEKEATDENENERPPQKKGTGKLKFKPKPTTDSSGAAAADALRQFFHRKKT